MWALWHHGGDIDPQLEPVYVDGETPEEVVENYASALKARIQQRGEDKWIYTVVPHKFETQLLPQNEGLYTSSWRYHPQHHGRDRARHTSRRDIGVLPSFRQHQGERNHD